MIKNKIEQKLYWVWSSLRQRCNNPNNSAYKNYGRRGIKICKEWDSFETFKRNMGFPNKGWTLDRINNNLGYSLKNCCWSLRKAQTRNRRNTKFYNINGKLMTLKEYSNENNVNYNTLKTRLQKGLEIEKVLYKGKHPNNNMYGHDNKGRFIKKDFHGRLCTIEEKNRRK